MSLRFLGRVVLGVLGQIAVSARLRNRLDNAGSLDLLATLQLLLESGVAGNSHRHFVHRIPYPNNRPTLAGAPSPQPVERAAKRRRLKSNPGVPSPRDRRRYRP